MVQALPNAVDDHHLPVFIHESVRELEKGLLSVWAVNKRAIGANQDCTIAHMFQRAPSSIKESA